MERRLQTHERRNTANESGTIGGFGVPQRIGLLKMLDVSERLLGVLFVEINPIAGRQILNVQVTVGGPRSRWHPHEMPQHVRSLIPLRPKAGNFDLLVARLAEP